MRLPARRSLGRGGLRKCWVRRIRREENRKNERGMLERLANELPDVWRRQEFTRQKFDEARRITNEITDEVNRHGASRPMPGPSGDSAGAVAELAERLRDAADKEAKVVARLRRWSRRSPPTAARAAARQKAEAAHRGFA